MLCPFWVFRYVVSLDRTADDGGDPNSYVFRASPAPKRTSNISNPGLLAASLHSTASSSSLSSRHRTADADGSSTSTSPAKAAEGGVEYRQHTDPGEDLPPAPDSDSTSPMLSPVFAAANSGGGSAFPFPDAEVDADTATVHTTVTYTTMTTTSTWVDGDAVASPATVKKETRHRSVSAKNVAVGRSATDTAVPSSSERVIKLSPDRFSDWDNTTGMPLSRQKRAAVAAAVIGSNAIGVLGADTVCWRWLDCASDDRCHRLPCSAQSLFAWAVRRCSQPFGFPHAQLIHRACMLVEAG